MPSRTPMRFALLTAAAVAAAVTAAMPAAAQTLTIAPAPGAEVGPFGNDASYGFTTSLIGQSFVAQNARLSTFTFQLRNEVPAGAVPQFRAFVADYDPLNGTIGTIRYTSGLLTGTVGSAFAPLTVTANVGLVTGLSYIAYLGGVTSPAGVNYLATNDGAPYASGVLVYDLGGSLFADASQDAAFTAVFAPAATTVPEPATVFLVAGGLAGAGLLARKRRAA